MRLLGQFDKRFTQINQILQQIKQKGGISPPNF
jgi:hypothetical protein